MDDSGIIGSADGEILIALKDTRIGRTKDYERMLRRELNHNFPEETFYFQPAKSQMKFLISAFQCRSMSKWSGRISGITT